MSGAIRKVIDIFWHPEGAGVAVDLDPLRIWTPGPNLLADMGPPFADLDPPTKLFF